ncbi:hypothetical protein [Paenibacillus oleatilyticus]|uniref:Uncharacterized protein n=1 Tax=Paenibacillus oleatilyticus TaxID=2594886 RepID=A0ABV4VCF4_9BACL
MSMYFNDKQLAELRKEFRTHPVDREGRVKPVEYSEEYVRETILKLLADIERLTKERNDHGPEGRNYTNGQYVELLLKYESMREALEWYADDANYKLGPNCGLGERARSVLAKIGEGEKP